ncbi:hypothetical protein [Sulfitobacter sp. M22]|uniref:hypothetical protein n=1 Tax=Sulfitobacter sp. M22 TaxID=2675332 RepID=UPI001F43B981|nr:hypothetical protein [Sulfitobacter sp. M22]MCF7725751.1 hypothetical protein [Sulfitobacter sp. M22]
MMTERLAAFVRGIELIDRDDPDTLKDAFMNEVIENGGRYIYTGIFEISLHGITSSDASEMSAIRYWRIAAIAALMNAENVAVEDDGFITVHPPCGTSRNHAEEIANAAAEDARRRSSYFSSLP